MAKSWLDKNWKTLAIVGGLGAVGFVASAAWKANRTVTNAANAGNDIIKSGQETAQNFLDPLNKLASDLGIAIDDLTAGQNALTGRLDALGNTINNYSQNGGVTTDKVPIPGNANVTYSTPGTPTPPSSSNTVSIPTIAGTATVTMPNSSSTVKIPTMFGTYDTGIRFGGSVTTKSSSSTTTSSVTAAVAGLKAVGAPASAVNDVKTLAGLTSIPKPGTAATTSQIASLIANKQTVPTAGLTGAQIQAIRKAQAQVK